MKSKIHYYDIFKRMTCERNYCIKLIIWKKKKKTVYWQHQWLIDQYIFWFAQSLCTLYFKINFHTQDTWTNDAGRISVDERQDCDDFDVARFHGGAVALTFTRKFDTCDDERDYLIRVSIRNVRFKLLFWSYYYDIVRSPKKSQYKYERRRK